MSVQDPAVLCGSLSRHPVSLGAAMHQAGYAALGLNWSYVPFRVVDLAGALMGMRALGIRGFGVSMPFKIQIQSHLDRIDEGAASIGAVNTVVNDDGQLTGFNTDAVGAVRALSEAMSLADASILVAGAGGAARALVYGLVSAGAKVHVVNRTRSKAEALAASIQQRLGGSVSAGPLADATGAQGFAALVNASSAGMAEYGSASAIPPAALRRDQVIMDIVYKPVETELVRSARSAGCRVIEGTRMLLHQAARQFELYTGRSAPLDAMEVGLKRALGSA